MIKLLITLLLKIPANSIAIVSRVGVGKLVYINHEYATSQDFINLVHLNYPFKFIMYSLYLLLKGEANKLQGTSIKGLTKRLIELSTKYT